MKRLVPIVVVAAALMTSSCSKALPSLGDQVPSDARLVERQLIMTGPSSLDKAYSLVRNATTFDLAVDKDGHVAYLSTRDTTFKTPEAINVGASLGQVMSVSEATVRKLPGWAFFVTLPSGWHAAFTHGETMTEGTLPPNASVVFLFISTGVK